jgi:oligopeptide/dipeptide ABC transporter ATP-binding protein
VTHDLGVVAQACQKVLVMYGGRVAEYGPVEQVFGSPRHPYTQRLLKAFPDLDNPLAVLSSIPGSPPRLSALPTGCRFHPRCPLAVERCVIETPIPRPVADRQLAACHLA